MLNVPGQNPCLQEPRAQKRGEVGDVGFGGCWKKLWTDPRPARLSPPRSVATASGLWVDAPCAAPPGLGVCRPSLPRPARRRPCGSRGSRGGPGRDPAQVAAPQARGAATPCPAASWAPRGRRLAGAPCCYCCCSATR